MRRQRPSGGDPWCGRRSSATRAARTRRSGAARLLVGAATTTLLLVLAIGAAAMPSTASTVTWVTNGGVNDVAKAGDTAYLGGSFTYIGPYTGPMVGLSATTGENLDAFPVFGFAGSTAIVSAVEPDGAGGWFVGGSFETADGAPRKNLAHVLPDGSLDPGWSPPAVNGEVTRIAVSGTRVYIGGPFTQVGPAADQGFSVLDATTGARVGTWAHGQASALGLDGSTLYVGTATAVRALDAATGAVLPLDVPVVGGQVRDLEIAGNSLFLGGAFTSVGGQARQNLAEIDLTTGLVTPWNPGASGGSGLVLDLAATTTSVWATGYFTTAGGASRPHGFVEIDRSTGLATSFSVQAAPVGSGGVTGTAVAVADGVVYWSGRFGMVDGQWRSAIASFDASTGDLLDWDPGLDLSALVLRVDGDTVVAAGALSSGGGMTRINLAAVDLTTGEVTSWAPTTGLVADPANPWSDPTRRGFVNTVATDDSSVYVGGRFSDVNDAPREHLAAVDAVTGATLPWAAGVSLPSGYASVQEIALDASGKVYVAGVFSQTSGGPRANLAAFDATGGLLPFSADLGGGYVGALAVGGGKLFIGGTFDSVDGTPRFNLAALDASSGAVDPDWQADVTEWWEYPPITTLALDDEDLYVGGTFSEVGGQQRFGLARLDAASGAVDSWAPGFEDAWVTSIVLLDGRVFVAGDDLYKFPGNQWREATVGALDAVTGATDPWDPYPDNPQSGSVRLLLTTDGGGLLTVGRFIDLYAATVANTPPSNTVLPSVQGTPAVGETLTCDPGTWTGTPPVGYAYEWLRDGSPIPGATGSSYEIIDDDDGAAVGCRVTATNGAGSAVADSNAVNVGSVGPGPAPCEGAPDRSSSGGPFVPVTVDFVNDTSGALVIYWLNYQGRRVWYRLLLPGGSYSQSAYAGQPWLAVEAGSGQCVDYTLAEEGEFRVTADLPDPPDTDGDGLYDTWETSGIDANDDGTVDLPLHLPPYNADPLHKDVFVEVDYMEAYEPQPGVLDDVVAAFAGASVSNPDGTTGVRLHAVLDEEVPAVVPISFGSVLGDPGEPNDFGDIKLGEWDATAPCDGYFGTEDERSASGCAELLDAKRRAFRYALFGHSYTEGPGSSGYSELVGNDFLVTVAGKAAEWIVAAGGLRKAESGTFMHELGHTLGLRHGGFQDEPNCKPNYQSVMSYARQVPNLDPSRPLDYSRALLPSLDEAHLDETAGTGAPSGSVIFGVNGLARVVSAGGPVDWDGDGSIETDVSADVSYVKRADGTALCAQSPDDTLSGHDDWAALQYSFRESGYYASGLGDTTSQDPTLPQPVPDPPPTEVQIVELTAQAALESAKAADSDGDGIPNANESICNLTRTDVQNSTKWQNARPAQRAVATALVNTGCKAINTIKPTTKPAVKQALIAAYKTSVNTLRATGWLTQTQATSLKELADTL